MVHLTRFRIGLLVSLGLILVASVYVITGPALLKKKTISTIVTQNLRDWTGAAVSVNGPTRLRYFPRPRIEIRRVNIAGIKRLPLITDLEAAKIEVELSLWSLISGTPVIDRVTLVEPQITSNSTSASTATQPASLVHALASAPFDQIRLVEGSVEVTSPERTGTLTNITANIDLKGAAGAHSSEGTFTWRKQPVSFRYSAEALSKVADAATMPITVMLDSDLFSAEIEGNAVIAEGVRVTGNLDLEIPNLPNYARWMGILVPDDPKQGRFAADGTFSWEGRRIGFDEGTFDLDGSRALGAMAIEIGGPRPQIEGTLALQKLDLTRYFETEEPAAASKKFEAGKEKAPKSVELDFPILHHINIDLRISTTQLTAGPLKLGQSAISFSLKSGKLMADLAVFDVCEGNANARLEFDATVPDSAFRLTGGMAGISTKSCLEIFTPESSLEGAADISADVTSKGRTAKELFDALNGKVHLAMGEGQADIDIPKLIVKLRDGPAAGWDAARGSATSFVSLDGAFLLRHGGVYTDSLKVDLGKSLIKGDGTIDLNSKALDIRLRMTDRTAITANPPQISPDDQKPEPRATGAIIVKGSWSEPVFSLIPAKSSAQNTRSDNPVQTALQGKY